MKKSWNDKAFIPSNPRPEFTRLFLPRTKVIIETETQRETEIAIQVIFKTETQSETEIDTKIVRDREIEIETKTVRDREGDKERVRETEIEAKNDAETEESHNGDIQKAQLVL